jgi:hypothetical protein
VEKYCTAGHATDGNIVQPDTPLMAISYKTAKMQFECGIPKAKIQTQIHDI